MSEFAKKQVNKRLCNAFCRNKSVCDIWLVFMKTHSVVALEKKNYVPEYVFPQLMIHSILKQSHIPGGAIGLLYSSTKSYSFLEKHNCRSYDNLVVPAIIKKKDEETLEESARSNTVTVSGHREAYWTTSEYMTISWTAVAGASEYNVYRSVNGIYGYVGTSTTTSFT